MTVFESRHPGTKNIYCFTRRRKRGDKITGSMRKGFNGKSGMLAMTDPKIAKKERPTVDRAGPMILSLKIIGAEKEGGRIEDVLTAHGSALYEFLMAAARIQGIENTEFRVSFDDAKAFLGISHNDRLVSLADQLRDTTVVYDFVLDRTQRWGQMPLLFTDFEKTDGKRYIVYSIHNAIRRVILESEQYAKLEINAFAQFSCKYTARLYPRLALMAQRHPSMQTAWIIEPQALAELIGYKYSSKFHFGNFAARCLDPVQTDIGQWVERFSVRFEPVRGSGRGSPVTHVKITTNTIFKGDNVPLAETQRTNLDIAGYEELNSALADGSAWERHMPPAVLVRAAATRSGYAPIELVRLWKEALVLLSKNTSVEFPHMQSPLKGYQLQETGRLHGVAAAFERWAKALLHKHAFKPIQEPAKSDRITVIKYDTAPSKIVEQPQTEELAALSPMEVYAHCHLEHPAWQVLIPVLSEDHYQSLHSAFVALRRPVSGFEDQHRFVTALLKIADQPDADQSAETGKIADKVRKEMLRRAQGLSNQASAAA